MTARTLSKPSTPSGSAKPQKAPPKFPCSHCDKVFKRSEHRARHERSHTKEKPFHCRYCYRRYARKDLVNRHERSFHPHADVLRLSEGVGPMDERYDVTMSEISNLPTPPSQTSETSSEKADSRTRSPWNEEYNTSISLEMLSPPLDIMPVNGPTFASGEREDDPKSQSVLTTQHNIPLQENVIEEDTLPNDRYKSKTSHLSSASSDFSENGQWDTSNMACSTIGYEGWLPAARVEVSHTSQDIYEDQNIFPDDFDLITIDSMALNHAALDADLSTYLNCSVSGPWDQILEHHTQGSGYSEVALPESTSLPIEASALNAGIADPGSPGILVRMPSLLKEPPRKTLAIPTMDENVYYTIMTSIRLQMSSTTDMEPLMSLQETEQFLKCYFVCFHKHFPIIHLPSLDLGTVPCHLILAMCAIGGLYRLRPRTAHNLWQCADQICEKAMRLDSDGDPLAAGATVNMQCKLLVSWFSLFSGDMTRQAISTSGAWTTQYRSCRVLLASTSRESGIDTWKQWILRETAKRLLYGIFIMSSMASLAYDTPPMFSITQDLDIELLDEEQLWEAPTRVEWTTLQEQRTHKPSVTVRAAFTHLVLGKEHCSSHTATYPLKWTAFSTSMIMHAVNIYMWHLMQSTQSFGAFAVEDTTALALKTAMVSQTEATLARCYALLTADRPERERTSDDPEGPLLFNCLALLRSAHIRVFTGADNFDRMTLLTGGPREVSASVQAFISGNSLERGPLMTRAVDKAYGAFLTPIKAGYLLVRKTAALTWSLEHPIAGWDCALFATKWVHTLEMSQLEISPTQDELMIISNFRDLLSEADSDYDGYGSLAGEIMGVWANLMDDTWTWGITPRMAKVMRKLSEAFKQDWNERFPDGNIGGPISQ